MPPVHRKKRKPAAKPPPPPKPVPPMKQPPSVFSGKGLFTTSDASSASNHPCDWVAVQKDPEGDSGPYTNNPARLMWWQARPTIEVIQRANELGIPYIGQAENEVELARCLELGPLLRVPKALVGNALSWTPQGFSEAHRQCFDLIVEHYMNAHPWEHAPDAADYPRFVNVCFGIYSEGEPGGEGYVPQLPLERYLSVWGGSFSCWKAESLTEDDWKVFARA